MTTTLPWQGSSPLGKKSFPASPETAQVDLLSACFRLGFLYTFHKHSEYLFFAYQERENPGFLRIGVVVVISLDRKAIWRDGRGNDVRENVKVSLPSAAIPPFSQMNLFLSVHLESANL